MTRVKAGAAITAALAFAFCLGHTSGGNSAQKPSQKVVTKTVTVTKDKVVKVRVPYVAPTCLELQRELGAYMAAVEAYASASAHVLDVESEGAKAIVLRDIRAMNRAQQDLMNLKARQVSPLAVLDDRAGVVNSLFAHCKADSQ